MTTVLLVGITPVFDF